ncbi:hypothetical protein COB57_05965 [Candidatus Peregrinibacteria bacterium]|nr:MAG: hypothetical protein COB57_05965 [Candidatus Peregrinibacteria bacterium]
MEKKVSVNISARTQRHASIDFQYGFLAKQKKQESRAFFRFSRKMFFVLIIFCFSYVSSLHLAPLYAEAESFFMETDFDFASSDSFVLSESGFVMKPVLQTEQGNRDTEYDIIEYTVDSGDTIYGIAARFHIRPQTLIDNNEGLSLWGALKVGKILQVLPVDGLKYILKEGDIPSAIAKKFRVKEEDLVRQNQLEERQIIAGDYVIIPGGKKVAPAPVVRSGTSSAVYTGVRSNRLVWPAAGKITQYFHRWHYAIDIADRGKGPINAAANGIVVKASYGWNGGYGNMMIIDHGNGLKTLYAHNQELYFSVGDSVTQGEKIAWMGNSGRVRGVTGIHLHFEVIKNGYKKNPLAYLGTR